jgi:hypothetical protein
MIFDPAFLRSEGPFDSSSTPGRRGGANKEGGLGFWERQKFEVLNQKLRTGQPWGFVPEMATPGVLRGTTVVPWGCYGGRHYEHYTMHYKAGYG